MSIVKLLHISDTHFGIEDFVNEQRRIVDQLNAAAHEHVNRTGDIPDICIFSGDLTQKGAPEELDKGKIWLRNLLMPWRRDCRLFIVPGNHDISRPLSNSEEKGIKKRSLRASYHDENSYSLGNSNPYL